MLGSTAADKGVTASARAFTAFCNDSRGAVAAQRRIEVRVVRHPRAVCCQAGGVRSAEAVAISEMIAALNMDMYEYITWHNTGKPSRAEADSASTKA